MGWDPAIHGFRPEEALTAIRIERQLGITLERFEKPTATAVDKGDWHNAANPMEVYDRCSPAGPQYFDAAWIRFKKTLGDKLADLKVTKVVIDITDLHLNPKQVTQLKVHLASLQTGARSKIMLVQ